MTRYKLTIEYQGTNYCGWQRQKEDAPTIQGEIEKAIKAFSGQDVTIQCAGRTDAGVHAWGQVAHVDFEEFSKPMEPFEITKAINAHLRPQPISIINTEVADDEFHARYGAKNKLYVYRILNRQSMPAIEAAHVWHIRRPLDAKAMHVAAQILLGQHDFSTFRDSECQAKNPVRTLDRLDVIAKPYDYFGGVEINIEAEAMSFLHHMVRNIVGTLTLVGEGKWSEQDLKAALEAKDRTKGGPTAPADGLYLKRILYS
ncbi:MAG: tRNA pseudouridine(38-40) synthase TruA [Pseudomonadota bacterium]